MPKGLIFCRIRRHAQLNKSREKQGRLLPKFVTSGKNIDDPYQKCMMFHGIDAKIIILC